MTEAFGQQLADDDNIWHELSQPAAGVASKPTCNAFELAIEVGTWLRLAVNICLVLVSGLSSKCHAQCLSRQAVDVRRELSAR